MEQKTNNSLMHKTKKELVDIILRKDDVHKELNRKVEVYKNAFAVISISNKQLKENIEALKISNSTYKNRLDSYSNTITNLETTVKHYNFKVSIYQILAIVEFIVLIIYICISVG